MARLHGAQGSLAFTDVSYTYRKRSGDGFSLGPINLDLKPGGVTALLGSNGAGKSTFLNLVTGALKPTQGRIQREGSVGFLPQSAQAPGHVSVKALYRYLCLLHGVPQADVNERITHALRTADVNDFYHTRLRELSGGQRQRVLIGSTLLAAPQLVLLDEPSSGLDIDQRHYLKDSLRDVADFTSLIISTHLVSDLPELAQTVIMLRHGRVVFHGSASDFIAPAGSANSNETWEAAFRYWNSEPQNAQGHSE